ncbi:MAG TPA: hypothetical protein VMS22_13770 [Candidatus Eisenbacteria bacterium]|nr:hypothetical protein [Candidatus Eisenbacteria bacterium]
MTAAQRNPLRVCNCTRCARPFASDGAYLRGMCPSCISLVVTCWSESRYRRMLTELAAAAALREGPRALIASLDAALARLPGACRHAVYLRDERQGSFRLAAPCVDAARALPSCVAEALHDCVGPVATITLAERDPRVGPACGALGWTTAVALRGDEGVVGVALLGSADATAVSDPKDLAYLSLVASAVGAGLARAHAVGLDLPAPTKVAPRWRWDRINVNRLGWLL